MSETIDPDHRRPPRPPEIETTVISAALVRAAMPPPNDPAPFDYDTRPIRDQGLVNLDVA